MADKRPLTETELNSLFQAARADAPVASADLIARITADAASQLRNTPPAPAPRAGWVAAVLGQIGGWPAAAGLVTATAAGLSIGIGTPETLNDLTGGYLAAATGYALEDLMPSYAEILNEG